MPAQPVLHWFDFICPFCYIAQDRNRILRDAAVSVIDLPKQIHPEIGPGGAAAPPRIGPMYEQLAQEAREAGLELNWSSRIPNSQFALAAAETVRINEPESHQAFNAAIFNAYFALGKDIGEWSVITKCAADLGIDPFIFKYQMTSGIADNELRYAEAQAHEHHVTATPSWLLDDQLIVGLRPRAFFIALSHALSRGDHCDRPDSNGSRTHDARDG
jgi:predicted DsbA family dithiol-disulfide isomerase